MLMTWSDGRYNTLFCALLPLLVIASLVFIAIQIIAPPLTYSQSLDPDKEPSEQPAKSLEVAEPMKSIELIKSVKLVESVEPLNAFEPVEVAEAVGFIETLKGFEAFLALEPVDSFLAGQPIKYKNITTFVLSISSLLEEVKMTQKLKSKKVRYHQKNGTLIHT